VCVGLREVFGISEITLVKDSHGMRHIKAEMAQSHECLCGMASQTSLVETADRRGAHCVVCLTKLGEMLETTGTPRNERQAVASLMGTSLRDIVELSAPPEEEDSTVILEAPEVMQDEDPVEVERQALKASVEVVQPKMTLLRRDAVSRDHGQMHLHSWNGGDMVSICLGDKPKSSLMMTREQAREIAAEIIELAK